MSAVKIRFLEARTVQDEHVGTDLETKYEAGNTYGFDARSAARWVKRRAAVFASPEDAAAAREAVGDFVEADPNEVREPEAGSPSEETALAHSFAVKLVAAHMGLTVEEFAAQPEAARIDAFNRVHAEYDESVAERERRQQASTGGRQEPPAGDGGKDLPDFDTLSDDDLRAYIKDRDGTFPHPNAKRETLLVKAKSASSD